MDMPLTTDYPAATVVRTGQAVYLPSPEEYQERFRRTWPIVKPYGRTSWAYLPLIVAGTTIGAWMAAFREPVDFTPDERSVLTTVARMLAQALSRASLHESERALSDGLQRTMLPAREPEIDGMAVAARYVPTGGGLQVGGDWYDVIALPSGRTALVIGDVQGHDVRAAGIMGQLRIALRAYAAEGHSPDAVLSRTSRFLAGLSSDGHSDDVRFATCLYLEVDPADRHSRPGPRRTPGARDPARRRHHDRAPHGGRAAAGRRAGRRLPDDPTGAGARRGAAAVHRRADRDRRPRHGDRLEAAGRRAGVGPGRRTWRRWPTRWCAPSTAPPRTTPPGR